jgi:hypothetical protein
MQVLLFDPETNDHTLIGEKMPEGGHKYTSGILAEDGKVYCIPASARKVLVIDTVTKSVNMIGDDLGNGEWKWFGCCKAKDGSIVAIPHCGDRILRITPPSLITSKVDTSTLTSLSPDSIPKSYSSLGPAGVNTAKGFNTGCGQSDGAKDPADRCRFNGSVCVNGLMFVVPAHHPKGFLCIDLKKDTVEMIGTEIFLDYSSSGDAYSDAIVGNDGKIYCIPLCASKVACINPSTKTVSLIGQDFGDQMWKWRGAVLSHDGKIYSAPDSIDAILCIDTTVEKPTATALNEEGKPWTKECKSGKDVEGKEKVGMKGHNGVFEGEVGGEWKLFCMPFWPDQCSVLVFDLENGATYLPVPPEIVGKPDDLKWWGGVADKEGVVYCLPAKSNHVLAFDPRKLNNYECIAERILVLRGELTDPTMESTFGPSSHNLLTTIVGDEAQSSKASAISTIGHDSVTRPFQYRGGAVLGCDGLIYAPPMDAPGAGILIINPALQSVHTIPVSMNEDPRNKDNSLGWMGSCCANTDGTKIYCTPHQWQDSSVLTIEPPTAPMLDCMNEVLHLSNKAEFFHNCLDYTPGALLDGTDREAFSKARRSLDFLRVLAMLAATPKGIPVVRDCLLQLLRLTKPSSLPKSGAGKGKRLVSAVRDMASSYRRAPSVADIDDTLSPCVDAGDVILELMDAIVYSSSWSWSDQNGGHMSTRIALASTLHSLVGLVECVNNCQSTSLHGNPTLLKFLRLKEVGSMLMRKTEATDGHQQSQYGSDDEDDKPVDTKKKFEKLPFAKWLLGELDKGGGSSGGVGVPPATIKHLRDLSKLMEGCLRRNEPVSASSFVSEFAAIKITSETDIQDLDKVFKDVKTGLYIVSTLPDCIFDITDAKTRDEILAIPLVRLALTHPRTHAIPWLSHRCKRPDMFSGTHAYLNFVSARETWMFNGKYRREDYTDFVNVISNDSPRLLPTIVSLKPSHARMLASTRLITKILDVKMM